MNEITGAGARHAAVPDPSVDRGALSEAWYRALYGSQKRASATPASAAHGANARTAAPAATRATKTPSLARSDDAPKRNAVSATAKRTVAIVRADRARADRAVRFPLPPRRAQTAIATRTTCRLTSPDGDDVELLIQQRGRRLHVVALARGERARGIAAALDRARAALVAHGLRIDIDTRPKGT